MNRWQQEVIEYLREENRILREKLGRKRQLLSIEQKRRLAIKGKAIGKDCEAQDATVCAEPRRRRVGFSEGKSYPDLLSREDWRT